jgi:hypothetical protein
MAPHISGAADQCGEDVFVLFCQIKPNKPAITTVKGNMPVE